MNEMFAQALMELPNECCGLLGGTVEAAGLGRAIRRYPLTNAAASPVEYLSDGREMFEAARDMRRRGIDVIAVYHSHPTSDPMPSKTDRERNYSTEVVNLIISLKTGTPVMRGWWLTAEGETEADWKAIESQVGD
jgi:[CysO sulfur-carrier protein]-S-L-cysteine hydrolase